MKFQVSILFICTLMFISACNDKPATPQGAGDAPSDLTVTPGTFQITILTPATDGSSISQSSVLSGHCGKPQFPITIVGNGMTIYSVCQNDYTWAAPVSAKTAPEGTINYAVTLRELNLTAGSPTINRSFIKIDAICQNSANLTKTFANFGDSGVDGVAVPYKICTSTQFSNIRYHADKKFQLAQDVDFALATITGIPTVFTGELDGRGFMLKDFVVKDIGGTNISVGLFRIVQNATIKNLTIMNGRVEASQRIGMLAGDWRGTGLIENVKVTGEVIATAFAGGLIGLANTTSNLVLRNVKTQIVVTANDYTGGAIGVINTNHGALLVENSTFNNTVNGKDFVGGFAGSISEDNSTFTNVSLNSTVNSVGHDVGGLAGLLAGGTLDNVRYVGTITTTLDNVDGFIGGLIGQTTATMDILNSSVVANINSGSHFNGGLVGRFNGGLITNSYSRGTLHIDENQFNGTVSSVGGLIGATQLNTAISQSYSQMSVTGRAFAVGGLVGVMNGADSSIHESYHTTGTINGRTRQVGGLVGDFKGQSITNSFARSTINISNPTPNAYIGGLVGYSQKAASSFSRLYYSGTLSINDGTADIVGGLFGYLRAASLRESFMSGTVQGARTRVGGLVGHLVDTNLSASFMSGSTIATLREVGGIAGAVTNGSVNDVFVSGTVQGSGNQGGLVGWLAGTAQLNRGYMSGILYKNAASAEADSTLGRLIGIKDTTATFANAFYYDLGIARRLSDNTTLPHNGFGVVRTNGQLRNQADYLTFNFTNNVNAFDWDMPSVGFKLPFQSTDFLYAVQDWMSLANYGFNLPLTWSDDPLNAIVAPILDTYGGILGSLTQDEYDAVTQSSAPSTVTAGQLQVTILEPSYDGAPIATKKLVYGECGVPGGVVRLSGNFTLNTICQTNHRWAAIIDATNKASGNLTLNAQLYNQAATSNSNLVSRILNKGNSLCASSNALKGLFANFSTGGNGTTVPYIICTAAQFRNAGYYPTAKYELANDLDFANAVIEPVRGTFRGQIDGKGFKVRNFKISKPGHAGIALFESVEDVTLKNISFEKFEISGYERSGVFAGTWRKTGIIENVSFKNGSLTGITFTGALAGIANTTSALNITNVTTDGLTVQGNNQAGALVGVIATTNGSFTLRNSTIKATVNGLSFVGGAVGQILQPNAVVDNVNYLGPVTALQTVVGGLFGEVESGNFTNLTVTGNLTANWPDVDLFAGGVFGHIKNTSTLDDIQYSGTIVAAGNYVGGLIGRLQVGTLTNALSSGTITVSSPTPGSIRNRVGGLIGGIGQTVTAPAVSLPSTLNAVSSSMTVNAVAQMVGGLVGEFGAPDSVLRNANYTGASVTGRTTLIGGAVGFMHGVTLEDSYATGHVIINVPQTNAYVGGLIGYSNSKVALHRRVWASGNVSSTSGTPDYLGGLYGYFRAGTLEDSYATGNVSGGRNSNGGLIGMHRGVLRRSFATGNVTSTLRHNGGLVGYLNIGVPLDPVAQPGINTIDPLIENCYSLGTVTSSGTVATDVSGGLVGYVNGPTGATGFVRNSYTRSSLARAAANTLPMAALGSVYGAAFNTNMVDASSLYYLDTNVSGGQSANGISRTNAQMTSAGNFVFDFASTPGWRIPASTTQVPGYGTNFPWPTLSWVGAGSSINQYRVRGTINGLAHSNIKLQLNGGEEITVNAGTTTFAFTLMLQTGAAYTVALTGQPSAPAISCTIANPSGTMGNADVTNVTVNCPTFQSLAIAGNSNMANGSSQALTVNATLSNNIVVNVTAQTTLSRTGTDFSLTGSTLNALSTGSTTVTANFLSLSVQRAFSSFAPPLAPTAIAWSTASPSTVPIITAQWTRSTSLNITSQRIEYFLNTGCSGTALTQKTLASTAATDSYTGTDALTYSFRVSAIDANSITATSACSTAMLINLPTPNPVTGLTVASTWKNGALPTTSPLHSWTNPSGISAVKVALGTTAGGSNIVGWGNIGNVTSYTFTNLSTLTACTQLYASVRTVNSFNKESSITTAAAWRWDNTSPAFAATPTISGIASENVSTIASWTIASDNCQLSHYEVAIGTSAGGSDIVNWLNIGTATSFQATSGVNGLNFTLLEGQNYYTSVRAIDAAGNISTVRTSASWQLPVAALAKIFWFDASERADIRDRANLDPDNGSFSGRVYQWMDRGTSGTLDAYGVSTTADPAFDSTDNHVTFNGTNQYLRIPTSAAFDNATFTFKSAFVSFKTSTDITSRQVIFEQGNRDRGMNIYMLSGNLYCGFWNSTNGGDGAQAIVTRSTPIAANTVYHAAVVLDYSNYTTATGPNGVVRCYLNTNQIGTDMVTTSRLYAHSNNAALGATYTGTRYHDSNTTATGSYFAGRIMEAFSLNQVVTPALAQSVLNAQMAKWSGGELSAPGNLTLTNNSTTLPSKAAKASWQPIVSDYFITDHYEMAIGTTSGGTEILFWSDIGNVTSYEARDGIDGINFTLINGVDYFISIKAVDAYGNESLPAISDSWQVYPAASLMLAGTFLRLDASDRVNILDANSANANAGGFLGIVNTWRNNINTALYNFTQATAANRPLYIAATDSIRFDQTNDSLSTPAATILSNTTVTQKVVTAVFTAGPDITTQQYIYDQGSNARGMGIYIMNGNLYCLFHNNTNGGDGAQAPVFQVIPITAGESYVVSLYLDYRNYTTSTGPNGTVGCYVNGVLQGTAATTSRLYADNSAVFIGARSNSRWHNSSSTGTGNYFGGEIMEVQVTNQVPTSAQGYIDLHNALMNKWQ